MDSQTAMDPVLTQYLEDMEKAMRDEYTGFSDNKLDILGQTISQNPGINSFEQHRSPQLGEFQFENDAHVFKHPGMDLFDSEMHSDRDRFELRDESKNNKEEYKESGLGYKKERIHSKWESKCDHEEDSQSQAKSKPVLTNKERARIARKRKKQYYDDLESRNQYLEERVKQLMRQNNNLEAYNVKDDWAKMIKCWPDDSHVFQVCNKYSESCRPFGTKKLETLENAFQTIIDSLYCEGTKNLLYAIDKDIPRSKAEFDSYEKLGKFQRHAKYPDPLIRGFIENNLLFNYTNDQYIDFFNNKIENIREFKEEVREAISSLYEAQFKIYNSLMSHDLLKSKLLMKNISKSQLLSIASKTKLKGVKIPFERIFNIQKTAVTVEKKIEIPDPKAFAKASVHGVVKNELGQLPKFVSDTFHTTVTSWKTDIE